MRRVFFGGSFHPPHRGHHEMLVALAQDAWVDHIHVVPTGGNPLKASQEVALLDQREAWVRAWLAQAAQDSSLTARWSLEDFEIQSARAGQGPNYTVDSLQILRFRYQPEDRWAMAVGADLLPQFAKWKDPQGLLSSLESVYVFSRGSVEAARALIEVPAEFRSLTTFRAFPQSIADDSSTQLREDLHHPTDNASRKRLLSELAPGVAALLLDPK